MEGLGTPEARLDEPRLRRLIEVGRALVSELDLDTLLNMVLDEARELTGARYAALGILNESRSGLERFLHSGVDPAARAAIGELPKGRGVLGLLIAKPKPLRLKEVGDHPESYGFPAGHPDMHTFLGVPILIRGEAYGNLYLTEKASGEFDETDEESAVVLGQWAAIAIENARLYSGIRRQQIHLAREVRGLEAMTEIARAVGGETDLPRVLDTVAKRARALVSARSLSILLQRGERMEVVATAGEVAGDVIGLRLPLDSAWGRSMRGDASEEAGDPSSEVGAELSDLGLDATTRLIVPLAFRGRPLGVIAAFDRRSPGPAFTRDDEELLGGFAAIAATAVATAQSVAEDRLRESIESSERERGRWARELHDETLQGLGAIRVLLSTAARSGSGDALSRAVAAAVEQVGVEIANLRGLISELRPAALDQLGLKAALESLAETHERTTGVEVETDIDLDDERAKLAQAELEGHLYRVAQECLTNVGKHANASSVRLALRSVQGAIELTVADDGVGFDPSRPTGGFGILGMKERVSLVGGSLALESASAEGTTIRAVLPARRAAGRLEANSG